MMSFILSYCYSQFFRRRLSEKKSGLPTMINHQYTRVSYTDLHKATNGFSTSNLIGVGSYGSVYKGMLSQTNTIVAVKVLNLQRRGALKSFVSECKALRTLRHRNLVKIITSCSSLDFHGNDFKALVFEFMPNGSLEQWLHELRDLNFLQRLNIAIDVACALDYLHHHCQPSIVHCDLKPSNVLLDNDMTAHVADFGLAKIFSPASYSQSLGSSSLVKGSIGYVAPEYGMGGKVSMRGDVYSYGILLLEMFTGKRPTDGMFLDGLNLHSYAKSNFPENVMKIMDPMILLESNEEAINTEYQTNRQVIMHECWGLAIRLGITCSAESRIERMTTGEVITELYRVRDRYQGVKGIISARALTRIYGISLQGSMIAQTAQPGLIGTTASTSSPHPWLGDSVVGSTQPKDDHSPIVYRYLKIEGSPAVIFSPDDLDTGSNIKNTLVIKFSSVRPPLPEIRDAIMQSWGILGDFITDVIDPRHILVQFQSELEVVKVMSRETFHIKGCWFRLLQWYPSYNHRNVSCYVSIWIELPELPLQFFQPAYLKTIARSIGNFLSMDKATRFDRNPHVARVCVEIDISVELPCRVWISSPSIQGFWQSIHYMSP